MTHVRLIPNSLPELMQIRETLEESDNLFARAGYKVFDTFHNIFTDMFQPGEISATITEVRLVFSFVVVNNISSTHCSIFLI